jgi:hypothetical protein
MPLVLDELALAVGKGLSNVTADRNRDVFVRLSVPQMDLARDVLKTKAPRTCVEFGIAPDPADPVPEGLREAEPEPSRHLGFVRDQCFVRPVETFIDLLNERLWLLP